MSYSGNGKKEKVFITTILGDASSSRHFGDAKSWTFVSGTKGPMYEMLHSGKLT